MVLSTGVVRWEVTSMASCAIGKTTTAQHIIIIIININNNNNKRREQRHLRIHDIVVPDVGHIDASQTGQMCHIRPGTCVSLLAADRS